MLGHPRPGTAVDVLAEELALVPGPRLPFGSYSRGNLRKAVLVAALASPGDLVVLDEPTANLDAPARRAMWVLLGRLAQQGSAVVVSEPLADVAFPDGVRTRAVELADGVLTARPTGTPHCRVVLRPSWPGHAPAPLPFPSTGHTGDDTVHLAVPASDLDALLIHALRTGWSVVEVSPQRSAT
jgi:hypothetical protein